jgi:hypothetical protein
VLAVAAIVLLAIGLGAAVYMVLPPSHPAVTIVVPRQPQPMDAGDISSGTAAALAQGASAPAIRSGKMGDAKSGLAPLPEGTPANPLDNSFPNRPANGEPKAGVSVDTAAFLATADANETLVIKVKAADVSLVNDRLIEYLAANNIAWSPVDANAIEQAVAGQSTVMAQQVGAVAGALAAAPTTQPTQAAYALKPAAETPVKEMVAQTDQPVAHDQDTAVTNLALDRRRVGGMPLRLGRPVSLTRDDLNLARNGQVIFVRNLNGQQLTELTAAIAQPPSQQQPMADNPNMMIAKLQPPQTQPASMPQLGFGQFAGTNDAPSTTRQLVPEARKQDAAESVLSKPNPADGHMAEALERLAGEGTSVWSVGRVASPLPTTRPATAAPLADQAAVTPKAAETIRALLPTTAPAAAEQQQSESAIALEMSAPSEGPFNCVIVLENSQSPAPASQPATQPTTQPAE